MVDAEEYRRLMGEESPSDFKEFLTSAPDLERLDARAADAS